MRRIVTYGMAVLFAAGVGAGCSGGGGKDEGNNDPQDIVPPADTDVTGPVALWSDSFETATWGWATGWLDSEPPAPYYSTEHATDGGQSLRIAFAFGPQGGLTHLQRMEWRDPRGFGNIAECQKALVDTYVDAQDFYLKLMLVVQGFSLEGQFTKAYKEILLPVGDTRDLELDFGAPTGITRFHLAAFMVSSPMPTAGTAYIDNLRCLAPETAETP